ncbi:MAG: radical SAM protein, partial [Bacillota bacterium]|nr:radical SAM protein [Bacillota bacterium]
MQYEGNVFRPPSEARSLIIQTTIGCSHNKCTFCYMYRDDVFRIRTQEEILADLDECSKLYPFVEKLFLADGDALVIPYPRLLEIVTYAKSVFPKLRQITMYATARDILGKSMEELESLHKAGLDMLYIGLESGSDAILKEINKNCTSEEFITAVKRAKEAGMKCSVTIILGLGQREKSREHALETARVLSEAKPEYVAFLNLRFKPGTELTKMVERGEFVRLNDVELLQEMKLFIQHLDS